MFLGFGIIWYIIAVLSFTSPDNSVNLHRFSYNTDELLAFCNILQTTKKLNVSWFYLPQKQEEAILELIFSRKLEIKIFQ